MKITITVEVDTVEDSSEIDELLKVLKEIKDKIKEKES
jgi:hypothetical protein